MFAPLHNSAGTSSLPKLFVASFFLTLVVSPCVSAFLLTQAVYALSVIRCRSLKLFPQALCMSDSSAESSKATSCRDRALLLLYRGLAVCTFLFFVLFVLLAPANALDAEEQGGARRQALQANWIGFALQTHGIASADGASQGIRRDDLGYCLPAAGCSRQRLSACEMTLQSKALRTGPVMIGVTRGRRGTGGRTGTARAACAAATTP